MKERSMKELRILNKDIKRKIVKDDCPYIDEALIQMTYDELRYLSELAIKEMGNKVEDHVLYLMKWKKVP